MKKTLGLLLLVVLAFTACGKKDEGTRGENAATARNTRSNGWGSTFDKNGPLGTTQLSGRVYGDSQEGFMDYVRGLVSATIPEDYLGSYVSAGLDGDNRTGVFFGGQVALTNGSVASGGLGSGTRQSVHSRSRLLITVYDNMVGRKDESGETIGAVPIYMENASGFVQGNQATITFSDDYGTIQMDGTFDGQYFTGEMSYDNNVMYDGSSPGAAGVGGYFRVPTCQFFVCN